MIEAPRTLTVVMRNDFQAIVAVTHLNESHPFEFRTVQIELTPEQRAALAPRITGMSNGKPIHETVYRCWFEPPEPTPVIEVKGEHNE